MLDSVQFAYTSFRLRGHMLADNRSDELIKEIMADI
jgi:hypothetical protein